MKFYISWSPTLSDPPYWRWISLDGIIISLGALKKKGLLKHALIRGLHEFLDFYGSIFLDSGSYGDSITGSENKPKTVEELLVLAEWLGVDMVAHLDTPFVGINAKISEERKWQLLDINILNAKITHEWEKRTKTSLQIVYVIQGWNIESIAFCAEEIAKLNARYYGLGSLARVPSTEIEKRVHLIRKIIGEKPKLHLFAVSSLNTLKKIKNLVDSVDSSTASIMGAMKEVIDPVGRRMHINKFKYMPECDCPVCKQRKGVIFLMGKRGSHIHYNKLRKIHNAYQIISKIKNI